MRARQSLVVFALSSLAAVAAQAEVVEMVLDVTATSKQVSYLDQGSLVTANEPLFQPQQFQWVVRFDLDQPSVYPVQAVNGTGGLQLAASTFFQGGATSTTPYSAALTSLIPAGAPVLSPDVTQAYASLATKNSLWLPTAVAQAVDIHTGFAGGGTWQSVSDGLATTTSYGRSFGFEGSAAPVLNRDFHPMSGLEFVTYLQSKVGQTQVGAFNESITQWVQRTNPPGDVILISGAPDALVAQNGIWISGNVSIQSVAVVPEPATYLLMGLGLSLVAAVHRRRQAA